MIGLRANSDLCVDEDIVRREELVTLQRLDQVDQGMWRRIRQHTQQAVAHADAVRQAAQHEAQQLRDAARQRFLRSGRLGYAAGQRRQLRDWNRQLIQCLRDEQQSWLQERHHWIDVVVDACSRLLRDADPQDLYRRAADALDQAGATGARSLTIQVALGEGPAAQKAFDALLADAHLPKLAISESEHLAPGDCRCEWSGGVLETGLKLELESLRIALNNTLAVNQTAATAPSAPDCNSHPEDLDDSA